MTEVFFMKYIGKFSYEELLLMPTDIRRIMLRKLIEAEEEKKKAIDKANQSH